MLKFQILLGVFLICTTFFAQSPLTIKVTYDFTDTFYDIEDKQTVLGTLIHQGEHSIYKNHIKKIIPGTTFVDEKNHLSGDLIDFDDTYYKNFSDDYILSYANVAYLKHAIAKDSIPLFSWQITNNKKEILGYNCLSAKTYFRGREYIAYFTTQIPVSDGPWKFNGLPGLILEVSDSTNRINYTAKKLEINNNPLTIISPFRHEESKSWEEIIIRAKKIYKAKKAEIEQKYTATSTVQFNGIEIYDLNARFN